MPIDLVSTTLLYAGLNGLIVTLLGFNVSRIRGQLQANVEAGVPSAMQRAHRAHGNAIEWVPLGLLLLCLVELSGGRRDLLHVAGGTLLLARMVHAVGMLRASKLSAVGAGLTYLVLIWLSLWAVVMHFAA